MNKTIIILWIFILTGGVFLGIQYTKPKATIQDINKIQITQDTATDHDKDYETSNDKNFTEHTKTADQAMSRNDQKTAIESYKIAITLNPNSTATLTKLATAYLKDSNPKLAQNVVNKAITLKPTSLALKLILIQTHLDLNQLKQAKDLTWTLDANDPRVIIYKGIISIAYKNFNEAKAQFQKISKTQNNIDEKYKTQANSFLSAFNTYSYFTEAEEEFLKLLLAKALVDNEQYKTAIPILYDITNSQNNYRDAWITMGYAYLKIQKPKEAIDALTQAKALDPKKPETLLFLGLAYFGNDELQKAIIYLNQAKENGYKPENDINQKLSNLYISSKEYQKAEAIFSGLLEQNKNNIEFSTKIVWLNIDKLNNPKKALKTALDAYNNDPKNAMSMNLVGWAYTANEDYTNGEKFLKLAIEKDPNLDAAYLNLGTLNETIGNKDLAEKYYKKAHEINKTGEIAQLAAIKFNQLISGTSSPTASKNNN